MTRGPGWRSWRGGGRRATCGRRGGGGRRRAGRRGWRPSGWHRDGASGGRVRRGGGTRRGGRWTWGARAARRGETSFGVLEADDVEAGLRAADGVVESAGVPGRAVEVAARGDAEGGAAGPGLGDQLEGGIGSGGVEVEGEV